MHFFFLVESWRYDRETSSTLHTVNLLRTHEILKLGTRPGPYARVSTRLWGERIWGGGFKVPREKFVCTERG